MSSKRRQYAPFQAEFQAGAIILKDCLSKKMKNTAF